MTHMMEWMNKRIILFLVVASALLAAESFGRKLNAREQGVRHPTVRMKATPVRVYLGESLRLQVLLDHFEKPELPDMAYLNDEFEVEYLGEQNRNSSMTIVTNGKSQTTEERGVTYNFRLKPKRAGTIRIESPEVRRGSAIATSVPVEIEVVPPSPHEEVRLKVQVEPQVVYPLTDFVVTLSVFVKALPGKYASLDPVRALSRQVAPSLLTIPWLEDDTLPKGLVPQTQWQEWIGPYRNRDGGFRVNNLRLNSSFDLMSSFFEERPSSPLFLPQGKKIKIKNEQGLNEDYWQYDFVRTFTAEIPGTYTFAAATIKGAFARESGNNELGVNDVYSLSNAAKVTVKDVPSDQTPENYIGAFGQFDWSATLIPNSVKVGEAMTLTLTLAGKGSVLNTKHPRIESIPEIAERFKVYPPTEEIQDDRVRFTYSIRPTQPGKTTFPPIPISYFDVKSEKFVTVASHAIDIEVSQSEVLDSRSTPQGDSTRSVKKRMLKKSSGGVFANRTELGAARSRRVTIVRWAQSVSCVGVIGLCGWAMLMVTRSEKLSTARRRSHIAKRARRDLLQAVSLFTQNDGRAADAVPLVKSAFFSPLEEQFDKPVATLTESEIRLLLERLALALPGESTLFESMRRLCDRLETLRYGQDRSTLDALVRDLEPLFEQWSRFAALRKNRSAINRTVRNSRKGFGRTGAMLFMLILLIAPGLTGCGTTHDHADRERFEEALQLFEQGDQLDQAEDGKESSVHAAREMFAKSAAVYQGMIEQGIESGPILYNQGNAWFRAGDKGKALVAWRKAARYMPRDPYLNAELDSVVSLFENRKGRPLAEIVLFWQNFLSYPVKYHLSFALAIIMVVSFLFWKYCGVNKRDSQEDFASDDKRTTALLARTARRMTLIVTVAFLVMTASALYDWYRFDYTRHVVVTANDVVPRKGNSNRYEALFTESLPERTEGVLIEEKGNWLRIRFPDGQDGWIEAKDAIVY